MTGRCLVEHKSVSGLCLVEWGQGGGEGDGSRDTAVVGDGSRRRMNGVGQRRTVTIGGGQHSGFRLPSLTDPHPSDQHLHPQPIPHIAQS